MKIFDQHGNELQESDINLERGYLSQDTRIKQGAKPIDNIEKFVWADEDYEEVTVYIKLPDDVWYERQIDELKRRLLDTDYVTIKIFEGVASKDDYEDVLAQRKEWRKQINELEVDLENLQQV